MLIKGKILTLEGNKDANGNFTKARCCPLNKEELVSRPIVIPFYLRGVFGGLTVGTEVVYTVFPDETGIILERVDGEWPGQTVPGTVTVKNGNVVADGISLQHHVHGGVDTGPGDTGEPK